MVRVTPAFTGEGTLADVLGPEGTTAQAHALRNVDPEVFTPVIDRTALASARPDVPLRCPVRVLRADPSVAAAFTSEDASRFGATNPHASVVVVNGASHAIHDEQPERFRAELQTLLDELA